MIRVKSNLSLKKLFVTLLFINSIWIFSCMFFLQGDVGTTFYCLISGVLSSVIGTMLFGTRYDEKDISVSFLLLYIIAIYYQLSTIKFFLIDGGYADFNRILEIRLMGELIVFTSIIIAIIFLPKLKYSLNYKLNQNKNDYAIGLTLNLLNLYVNYYYIKNIFISSYLTGIRSIDTESQLIIFGLNIMHGISMFYSLKAWNSKFISKIPAALFLLTILYVSLMTGSRTIFAKIMILYIFLLVILNKKNKNILLMIYTFSPLLVLVLSSVVFVISGRGFNTALFSDLAYRFNLSDLCITFLERGSWINFDFGIIFDGLKICIPSVFIDDKSINAYSNFLIKIGMNPHIDYTDTIFSSSVMILGIFGALFCTYMYCRFNLILQYLINKKDSKINILILIYYLIICINIEIDFTFYFASLRNFFIIYLFIRISEILTSKLRV